MKEPRRPSASLAMIGDLPVLSAYRDGICLLVWCEHEQVWHTHGGCGGRCAPRRKRRWSAQCECPPGTGDGPRAAHCVCRRCRDRWPGGYTLREAGPLTAAVRRAHRELSYSRRCRYTDCRFERITRRHKRQGAA